MHRAVLIWVSLIVGDVHDYSRPLDAKQLDQATLETESFGEKKVLKREDDGLRITLAPGEAETGWKTPQALKVGGNFTITAEYVIRKLPKPALDDGVAIGLAIASQNLDQPDATLIRLLEPSGADVYRSIDKAGQGQQGGMVMTPDGMMMQAGARIGGKVVKPPRMTFRAQGETFRLELQREGSTVRYHVLDSESHLLRYVGQVELGSNDISGVKLFATNRNGAEALDVLLKSLTIRADRITGLGTVVRTVFGEVVRGEPTAIEDGRLVIGGPPKNPTPSPTATANKKPTEKAAAKENAQPATETAKEEKSKDKEATKEEKPKDKEAAKDEKPKDKEATKDEKPKDKEVAAATKPAAPKAKIPLDEVEQIAFEKALTLSGRLLGQPNLDFTMRGLTETKDGAAKPAAKGDDALAPPPGTVAAAKIPKLEPKPNGICDLHLTLANLNNSVIKQVTINAQTDKGPTAWRLDTTNSKDWPLVLRRAGTETWADVFLEPPDGDLNGKDLTVSVTYADGQSGNTTIKADKKTDPKLTFDPKAPAPSLDARIYLTGDEQLFGKFEGLGEESLRLRTPWGDRLIVPLARVAGIYMGMPDHKESSEAFAKRLVARGTEDLLLARSKDDEVVAIPGIAEGTEEGKLLFHFQEKTRSLALKQVEGLVLAARPEPEPAKGLRPTFSMAGGIVVSGLWKDLDSKTWKIETAWGENLDLPAAEVRDVRFRGGQMTYLSDLVPSRVEETPFFGRRSPWRKNVNLAGAPLKMEGRTYANGLAVHSRSALTYDLDGHYSTFATVVGFDETAKGLGRVECRIFADSKEIYTNLDLRADTPPVTLSLPVTGIAQLRLLVDFGPGQDTGDRVIWANARLYRRPPPTSGSPSPSDSKPGMNPSPTSTHSDQAPSPNPKTGSGQ